MVNFSKVWYSIKLTGLISFFFYTLSSLFLKWLNSINGYLQNTYLITLNNIINNVFVVGFFIGLKYLSLVFLIGCLISFFIILYHEVINNKVVH